MVGTASGRKTRVRICRSDPPSMTAASASSFGTPMNAVLRIITFQATSALGMTMAKRGVVHANPSYYEKGRYESAGEGTL